MADYRLSRLADLDVAGIAELSVRRFGLVKARQYRNELIQCFSRLAEQPEIGRRAGHPGAGLRRYLLGKHISLLPANRSGHSSRPRAAFPHGSSEAYRQF